MKIKEQALFFDVGTHMYSIPILSSNDKSMHRMDFPLGRKQVIEMYATKECVTIGCSLTSVKYSMSSSNAAEAQMS